MAQANSDIMQRFLEKVEKTEDCWFWIGNRRSSGYGLFFLNGKLIGAHVASFIIHFGPLEPGLIIRHKNICGNKDCVKPDHLEAGTHSDNMRDWWGIRNHKRKPKLRSNIPGRGEGWLEV